jgi:hypothetical protein
MDTQFLSGDGENILEIHGGGDCIVHLKMV